MPRMQGSSAFTGQSLKGMELDVKMESQGTATWANLFAATALDVQVAAATTSRQHTLNVGSRTSTGVAGEITGTADVFVVPDSPGQWTINEAFKSGEKVDLRRTVFGSQVGATAGVALAATSGKVVSYQVKAPPSAASLPGAAIPRAAGLFDWNDGGDDAALKALLSEAEPGMTIQVSAGADTFNYFIGYRGPNSGGNAVLYISPSPIVAGGTTTAITDYPYIGAAHPAAVQNSGTVKLYRGRVETTHYKGTVTVPVVATDAAPGDDGNDLSTAQISFALDDIGTPSYNFT